MKKIPTWICVVALALTRDDGCWLMHRRPPGKHHGGLWEFPGGKVEAGESPRAALVREIAEELGIAVRESDLAPAGFAEAPGSGAAPPLVILLYTCRRALGEARALEGGEVGWFSEQEIAGLALPPLDIALARGLFAKVG